MAFRVAGIIAYLSSTFLGIRAAFPHGTQEVLQDIVDRKSTEYDCAISVALFDGKEFITAVAGTVEAGSTDAVTAEDKFVWGSGTKPLTGVSLLKLVEEGKLRLQDKVAPIVDPFLARLRAKDPSQKFSSLEDLWGKNVSDVTVEQLATMTICTPDFDTAQPYGSILRDPLRAELYAHSNTAYSPTKLMSESWVAGQKMRGHGYSSTNFMVLGLLLAAKAQVESWSDFDQGQVLPEGLRSGFRFGATGAPRNFTPVHGYDRTSYNMPANRTNNQDVWAVDGVFSGWTASDMVASPSSLAELYWDIYGPHPRIAVSSPQIMGNPGGFYGFATFNLTGRTGQNSSYGHAWGHLGATYGYDSIILYFPELEFTMAVASNMENDHQSHPTDTACIAYNAIAGMMLGQKVHCTFKDAGYHGGGCTCSQFAPPAAIVV